MTEEIEEVIRGLIIDAGMYIAKAESYNWSTDEGEQEANRCVKLATRNQKIAGWLLELVKLKYETSSKE